MSLFIKAYASGGAGSKAFRSAYKNAKKAGYSEEQAQAMGNAARKNTNQQNAQSRREQRANQSTNGRP